MAVRSVHVTRGDVVTNELWYEADLGDWVAAWRLLPQGGRVVFGELRLFPNEPRRKAGRWSADRLGDRAQVPGGGITVRELRRLVREIGRHRGQARAEVGRWIGKERRRKQPLFHPFGPEGLFERHGRTEAFVDLASGEVSGSTPHLPPKRMRRDERFYAEMAAAYAEAVSAGNKRPVDTIAEALGRSRNTVKDVIREARARGLLTETTHGRAGGRLTAKAKKLLKQRDTGRPVDRATR
jgi:biotin operon repressor